MKITYRAVVVVYGLDMRVSVMWGAIMVLVRRWCSGVVSTIEPACVILVRVFVDVVV